jgi:hypothetical protein
MKSEDKIQQEIVIYVRNYRKDLIIFSVPNDGRNAQEQMRKKAMGLLRGVSDLILLSEHGCFFIEVKTDSGKQSEEQIKFQKAIETLGFTYHLVRSLEDFKQIVK